MDGIRTNRAERRSNRDRIPRVSLMRCLERGYERTPAKTMIVDGDGAQTYAECYQGAYALAIFFHYDLRLVRGDTVLISAPNVSCFPLIIAAAQALGLRLALMSSSPGRDDFTRAIAMLDPRLVIVARDDHVRMIRDIAPALALMGVAGTFEGLISVEDAVACPVSLESYDLPADENDDSPIILFSSGSTGLPKPIVNRSSSFERNALALTAGLGMGQDDILYVPVPFTHVYGFIGIYAALVRNATIATNMKYSPQTSLSVVSASRATVYFGVSTMYLREMRVNADDTWDISSLRLGMVAGASCSEETIEEYEKKYGCKLVQSYGMTETAATLTVNSPDDSLAIRAKSVGPCIPGVAITIAPDTGEILCKTPSLMVGTIGEAGQMIPAETDGNGFFHTGDVGRFDEKGRLYITGRIKDMIIRGGINIFPSEIENFYHTHPDVDECYVVGYPDPELGERTCLCVIMKGWADDSAHGLREYARGRIEKCKYPDTVLKMDDMPRLTNGKIDRKKLKDQVATILDPSKRSRLQRRVSGS